MQELIDLHLFIFTYLYLFICIYLFIFVYFYLFIFIYLFIYILSRVCVLWCAWHRCLALISHLYNTVEPTAKGIYSFKNIFSAAFQEPEATEEQIEIDMEGSDDDEKVLDTSGFNPVFVRPKTAEPKSAEPNSKKKLLRLEKKKRRTGWGQLEAALGKPIESRRKK
jgi:hypothetical protein